MGAELIILNGEDVCATGLSLEERAARIINPDAWDFEKVRRGLFAQFGPDAAHYSAHDAMGQLQDSALERARKIVALCLAVTTPQS